MNLDKIYQQQKYKMSIHTLDVYKVITQMIHLKELTT